MGDVLSEELKLASILSEENPCLMNSLTKRTLAEALKALIKTDYSRGVNQDRLARYYNVSVRTIQRWQKTFDDFPQPRNTGNGQVFYDPQEVIEWKSTHRELFDSRFRAT